MKITDFSDTAPARFWAKVDRLGPSECWNWKGATNGRGYGVMQSGGRGGKLVAAHRFSLVLAVGEISPDAHVRHSCDNPACVNPAHLAAGTRSDNMRDMFAKGRANRARGERAGKAKLTAPEVRTIRARDARGEKHPAIAADYGISVSSVWAIARRKHWAHVPS